MQSSIPKEFEDMQSNINRAYSGGVVNGMSWWLGGNPKFGSRIGFTAIRDGTSNTAAFSEWIKGKAGANTPGLNWFTRSRSFRSAARSRSSFEMRSDR
jgi:hypothetical protein